MLVWLFVRVAAGSRPCAQAQVGSGNRSCGTDGHQQTPAPIGRTLRSRGRGEILTLNLTRRWGGLPQGLLHADPDLILGLTGKPVGRHRIEAGRQLPGCSTQELELGGIAPAPDAIKQMQPHPQALIPRELRIHRLRHHPCNLPAV
jgi:hypothetical protein